MEAAEALPACLMGLQSASLATMFAPLFRGFWHYMSSDTLIREVDEELRRDRLRKLWRQFGPWVIAAAVAVVLGVAGYEFWINWQKSQAAQSSDRFYEATTLASGKDADAAKKALDDIIAQGSGGYPMLARFREAALLSQQGKIDEAVAAYDTLAGSADNVRVRELALVLASYALADKGDVTGVQQRISTVNTPTDPLRNAAREALGLAQYKAGKLDDALATFGSILSDQLANQDVQQRADLYAQELTAEGAKSKVPAAAAAPSGSPADASAEAANIIQQLQSALASAPASDASAPAATASQPASVAASTPTIAASASAPASASAVAPASTP